MAILKRENQSLGRLTFVTSLGDFLSLFATMQLVHTLTGSVGVSAYLVAMKALSVPLAGLLFPSLSSRFSTRQLIVSSQAISGVLSALLVFGVDRLNSEHASLLFAFLFVQSVLKRIFDNARETHSKMLGSVETHRSLQAELLHGFYGAQAMGPIISYILISRAPLRVSILIDCLSFFIAATLGLKLQDIRVPIRRRIFAPLFYLNKTPALLRIFLLRGVGYWIPIGIFNYMLFGVVTDHYNLHLINSAWIYAAVGLGSAFATGLLKSEANSTWLSKISDGQVASGALFVLSLTRIAFIKLPVFVFALGMVFIGGICNGLNATATQSLRRKLTTEEQFPEVVGLEQVVAGLTDFSVQTGCLFLLSNHYISFVQGVWLSALTLVIFALLHLNKDFRI